MWIYGSCVQNGTMNLIAITKVQEVCVAFLCYWLFFLQNVLFLDVLRRAVKLNKGNSHLWTEFFKLECIIAAPDPEEMAIDENDEEKKKDEPKKEKTDDPFKLYDIPWLIYEEAVKRMCDYFSRQNLYSTFSSRNFSS